MSSWDNVPAEDEERLLLLPAPCCRASAATQRPELGPELHTDPQADLRPGEPGAAALSVVALAAACWPSLDRWDPVGEGRQQ